MVLLCLVYCVVLLFSRNYWTALLVGVGGSLYWIAMSRAFRAVAVLPPPMPWDRRQERSDEQDPSLEKDGRQSTAKRETGKRSRVDP